MLGSDVLPVVVGRDGLDVLAVVVEALGRLGLGRFGDERAVVVGMLGGILVGGLLLGRLLLVDGLVGVLRAPDVVRSIPEIDRANLAKYLTIAKLKLENAIAMVRSGDSGG